MTTSESKVSASVIDVDNENDFNKLIGVENLTVAHFWTIWADQCEAMHDAMKVMAEEDPEVAAVQFLRVDAEQASEISSEFEVAAFPTFLFFRSGQLINRVEGAKVADVAQAVKKFATQKISFSRASSARAEPVAEDHHSAKNNPLEARLKALINSAKCMVFMKGNPSAPKCGFGRQTVELLQNLNADFETFDILSDDEIRQGLKTYSKWPTYPQIYINGDLIGGLDILKEMHSSGDLETLIPKRKDKISRIEKLLNKHKIVLFTDEPVDNSKASKILSFLRPLDVDVKIVDVTESDTLREEFEKFSSESNYPQLWISGKLIGGLSEVEDRMASGDLSHLLNKRNS